MLASLWLCATLGGTYVKLGELSDMKLKIDGKEIDTSNVDDAGWGSSIAGSKSADVSVTNNLLMEDAGYALLEAAIESSDMTIYAKILQSGTPTATPVGWSGLMRVSSPNYTLVGTNTQQKLDFSLKNVGALSRIT
jgi:predicted secreted protein